jgi:hypothetical protein
MLAEDPPVFFCILHIPKYIQDFMYLFALIMASVFLQFSCGLVQASKATSQKAKQAMSEITQVKSQILFPQQQRVITWIC